ncbi:MAG: PST family polysaccharide transporter [Gammaproteobacteria bacterium]|jgi:PST family polysaccharide transporter
MTDLSSKTYTQILKSSIVIGGAQMINFLLTAVRVKFVAILIGPLGVGLVSTYQSILEVLGTAAGLGIQQSAVRNVSQAIGSGDEVSIARTILTLRRISLITGIAGAMVMIAVASKLSHYTFGTDEHTLNISMLGLIILFSNISGGQTALIQGMRRIGDLARMNVAGATVGTIVVVALYTWLGLKGIIPALLSLSLIQLIFSWYFARKVAVPKVEMSWKESILNAGGMLPLGLSFMWGGILVAAVTYFTRTLIAQGYSLEAVGIYTAAFSLSGMFINFVLAAMAADYYPRLTAVAHEHNTMNQLVNEQTEIGLLLAVPGLLATLTLAPWIIRIFYTSQFLPAVVLLQWFILGCLIRVLSWPMGYIILALGKGLEFAAIQTVFNVVHLALILAGLNAIGLEGAAVAFFVAYLFSLALNLFVFRYLTGFKWSPPTSRLILTIFPIVAIAFFSGRMLPEWFATVGGLIFTVIVTVFCLRGLVQRIGSEHRIVQMSFRVPGMRWACGLGKIRNFSDDLK